MIKQSAVAALMLAACIVALTACGGSKNNAKPAKSATPVTSSAGVSIAATPAGTLASGASALAGTSAAGASPATQASSTPSGTYTIQAGDTLTKIAAKLGVSLSALEAANSNVDARHLHVGQRLMLPTAGSATAQVAAGQSPSPAATSAATSTGGSQSYTVRAGDTACKIAVHFQVGLEQLASANGVSVASLTQLHPGQTLKIPASTGSAQGCQ